MLSNILLSTAILAASVLGAAVPTDFLAIALARGIDVHGPIPSDATLVPTGGWTFEADSDAAIWVRARFAATAALPLEKRTQSGLNIGLWTGGTCTGGGYFVDNVTYGQQNVAPASNLYNSVEIDGHLMRSNEQLDVSARSGGDLCAIYKASFTNNDSSCHNKLGISCFRLTEH